jgi:hypothetical protein
MARHFTSRCPYFHKPQASENIAWEWNLSPHHTLTSVVNLLLYNRHPLWWIRPDTLLNIEWPRLGQERVVFERWWSLNRGMGTGPSGLWIEVVSEYRWSKGQTYHEITTIWYRQLSHRLRTYSEDYRTIHFISHVGFFSYHFYLSKYSYPGPCFCFISFIGKLPHKSVDLTWWKLRPKYGLIPIFGSWDIVGSWIILQSPLNIAG